MVAVLIEVLQLSLNYQQVDFLSLQSSLLWEEMRGLV